MRKQAKFGRPPVVELACGVEFKTDSPIMSAHVGLYWQTILDRYPNTVDNVPLGRPVEAPQGQEPIQINMPILPALRRSWFTSRDGRFLIQIQEDWFIFNWKKAEDDDSYPSFDNVFPEFEKEFDAFRAFLAEHNVTVTTLSEFELTYVNHIVPQPSFHGGSLHQFLVDKKREESRGRALSAPQGFRYNETYLLPHNAGRLNFTAVTARRNADGAELLRLDLSAKGRMPTPAQDRQIREWFSLAHEQIVSAFVDLTDPILHDIWGIEQ